MSIKLNPYVHFKDNAREAMAFYQSVFGGTLEVTTFKEMGLSQGADDENLVVHSALVTPDGLTIMASDTPPSLMHAPGTTFSVSISGDDAATLTGYFNQLANGGVVTMALEAAAWGGTFGMCIDKFGVSWICNIA